MANISQINGNLLNAATASLAVTASFALAVAGGGGGAAFPFTGSARITGSLDVIGSTTITGSLNVSAGITGSLLGTASFATSASRAISSSFATTAQTLLGSVSTASYVINTVTGTNSADLVYGNMADNDQFRIRIGGTATNAGFVEIATADDGTEPIHVRQYSGVFSSLVRTATLLDGSGNSSFPGGVTATSFTGSLQGTATTATNANNVAVTDTTTGTGPYYVMFADGTTGNRAVRVDSAALTFNATTNVLTTTASFATTASFLLGSVTSASFASTASFVNTLNQNVIISGSVIIGSSSLGPSENTLTLGARDAVNEGGQLGFNAPGGSYTSASFLDHYQNRFRLLRGTNAGSTNEIAWWSMNNLQMALPAYTGSGAFPGTEAAMLGVDTSGNVLTTSIIGSTIFGNYAGTGFTNPVVTYLPFGTTSVSAAEAQRQIASPFTGLLKNVYIRTNGAAAATSFTTFTIRVNSVATNIKINISGGQTAGLYSNILNSASVAVGDEISLQVSTSVANGPQVNQYSFGIYPS